MNLTNSRNSVKVVRSKVTNSINNSSSLEILQNKFRPGNSFYKGDREIKFEKAMNHVKTLQRVTDDLVRK
jgi:hypothetical protein